MRVLGALAVCLSLTLGAAAFAENPGKAKEHFFKAKGLYDEGALEKAILEFEKSYEYSAVPLVLYNIAVCYDELHKYAEALNYYTRYIIEVEDLPEDKKAAIEERIDKIKEFIGTLELTVTQEAAEVIIDGKLVGHTPYGSIPLETGEHDLLLRKVGHADLKKKFKITSGEVTTLVLEMTKIESSAALAGPPPDEPPEEPEDEEPEETEEPVEPPSKKIGPGGFWFTFGFTSATFIAVAITGSLAIKAEKEFLDNYLEDKDQWRPLEKKARTLALTTDVLIGVGAASALTAIILATVTDFKGERKSKVSLNPTLTGSGAGLVLSGTF